MQPNDTLCNQMIHYAPLCKSCKEPQWAGVSEGNNVIVGALCGKCDPLNSSVFFKRIEDVQPGERSPVAECCSTGTCTDNEP